MVWNDEETRSFLSVAELDRASVTEFYEKSTPMRPSV